MNFEHAVEELFVKLEANLFVIVRGGCTDVASEKPNSDKVKYLVLGKAWGLRNGRKMMKSDNKILYRLTTLPHLSQFIYFSCLAASRLPKM